MLRERLNKADIRELEDQRVGAVSTDENDSPNFTLQPWEPLFELSAASLTTRDDETGRWACECLLSLLDVPPDERQQTRQRAIFFTPTLAGVAPGAHFRSILFDVPPLWSRFNPSIDVDGLGYRVIVRSSNFGAEGPGSVLTPDGVASTVNYLASLDSALNLIGVQPIEDRTELRRYPLSGQTTGLHDCHLFRWRDEWWATATTREHNPQGLAQFGLVQLRDSSFTHLHLLSHPEIGRDEKNWMPLVLGHDLYFIYSCHPTLVFRYTYQGIEQVANHSGPVIAQDFKGGSQGVVVDDGYLFVVHETVSLESGRRLCPHRFILLDRDFRLTQISAQFFLVGDTVGLCRGLTRRNDELLLSFGFLNREAFVARVSLLEVLASLRPVYG